MDKMNTILSERFELLSAYLDNEASPEERMQVETWLAEDPEFKKLYRQMSSLHYSFQDLPAVEPSIHPEVLVKSVMTRLDRRSRVWRWGGLGTVAAVLVGGLSSLMGGNAPWTPQLAQPAKEPINIAAKPDPVVQEDARALMLALDQPPVAIPVVDRPGAHSLEDPANF
jgi:anti-sigma factor RsiW